MIHFLPFLTTSPCEKKKSVHSEGVHTEYSEKRWSFLPNLQNSPQNLVFEVDNNAITSKSLENGVLSHSTGFWKMHSLNEQPLPDESQTFQCTSSTVQRKTKTRLKGLQGEKDDRRWKTVIYEIELINVKLQFINLGGGGDVQRRERSIVFMQSKTFRQWPQ